MADLSSFNQNQDIVEDRPSYNTVDTAKTNPFACNVCGRNYSRVDHLARHYRSHTREKPFCCSTCNKTFGRADLLKRHSISHNAGQRDKRQHSSPQVTRVAQACVACATAKLKCGHEKPCQRCEQRGITCTFPPLNEKLKSSFRKPDTQNEQHHMLDLDGLEVAATLSTMDQNRNASTSINRTFPQEMTSIGSETSQMADPNLTGSSVSDDPMLDLDDSSLAGFLRDVMMPPSPNPMMTPTHMGDFITQPYPVRDIFNFGIDANLEFNELDFGWISSQNAWNFTALPENDQILDRGPETPNIRSGITAGAEAFERSLWRWAPQKQEHAYAEQINLSLPYKDLQNLEARLVHEVHGPHLEQNSRDRILAMLLSICEPGNVSRVVTSFPSSELLESLMQLFFQAELSRTDSWIHIPTFRPQTQRPELNGIVIAAGALLSKNQTVRKLGFAIQEAVRLAIPQICEKDNSTTRELQLLQTFALQLSVGLWSGNKRKMEIAESHAQPLITMIRRAGQFRRRPQSSAPELCDDDATLESKWRCWVEAESFKRLAFHVLIHDSEASMSLLTRPLISYAEVSLELPWSLELWRATSARIWREIYLKKAPVLSARLPSLMNCVHDIQPLSKVRDCIDLQFSTSIILHAIWSLVAEYRQLDFVLKVQSAERHWNGALISTSWHQELCQLLDHFRLTVSGWESGMTEETLILQDLFMMNLHVSFEELQLFAGKEGNEEAQRVYPLLKQWFDSKRSRQAVFHAGQVLRAANSSPPGYLRDFYAVAIYHAALCFWVWGMCSMGQSKPLTHMGNTLIVDVEEIILLDGEDTANTRRFIALARGIPMIRAFSRNGESNGGCRLDDPKAVMETIINIMIRSCADGSALPPLVENLGQLMKDLGNAAWAVSCHER